MPNYARGVSPSPIGALPHSIYLVLVPLERRKPIEEQTMPGLKHPKSLGILLVEDDPAAREHLSGILASTGEFVVLSAGTLAGGIKALDSNPDIVLTDIMLPDGSGLELIRSAMSKPTKPQIMVNSVLGDEESVLRAIRLGANGYILKDAYPRDILSAVRELLTGNSPISASIARHIVRQTQQSFDSSNGSASIKLTSRETDVLWGIAKGFSYSDIATHLNISSQTVPGHIKNIYRKLQVNNRGEAVFEAIQKGIINLK